jgi:hypothetical protein
MNDYRASAKMLRSVFGCAIVFTVLFSAGISFPHATKVQNSRGKRYTLKINNCSRFRIDRIYVSHTYDSDWGKDLLGRGHLYPEKDYSITVVAGEYDVRFVDEDGDECIINEVALFKDTTWCITTSWLKKCVR